MLFRSALVLSSAAVVLGDWLWRNAEMNALVTAVEGSEAAMGRTQDDLRGIARGITASSKAVDIAKLSDAAGRGENRIANAGYAVGAVQVAPWHRRILEAKAAYVRHNQAWQDYMSAIATDPKVYGSDQPEINDSFMASEPLMKEAVPIPALYDLVKRVSDIYTEGAPPAQSDGQQVLLRR